MIAKWESDLFNLKVLLPIILIITLTKFVIYKGLFLNQNTRNSKIFFASSEKKLFMCVPDGTYYHIKAEIRAVDSQSDLRILL